MNLLPLCLALPLLHPGQPMELVVELRGPGLVERATGAGGSLWLEGCDGQQLPLGSGEVDWAQQRYPLPEGAWCALHVSAPTPVWVSGRGEAGEFLTLAAIGERRIPLQPPAVAVLEEGLRLEVRCAAAGAPTGLEAALPAPLR